MNTTGKLYIIATPIGNLEDITLRALRVLREVDLILCEDTRVTKKLLDRYGVKKPLLSYHHHSKLSRVEKIVEYLRVGKILALVSDAGTPGISDPGNELVAMLTKNKLLSVSKTKSFDSQGLSLRVDIIPVPGPSVLTAIASIAGVNMSKFIFMGYPPHKKGREKFFREVAESRCPVVYFETPHRFLKNLELLEKFCPSARLVVGRELTKAFEEIRRGEIEEILKYYRSNIDKVKGEFVIVKYQ